MKILVDKLPLTCGECEYCADAMVPTALGIPKQVKACTLKTLVPPVMGKDNEPIVEPMNSPKENDCPCAQLGDEVEENNKPKEVVIKNGVTSSGIIL